MENVSTVCDELGLRVSGRPNRKAWRKQLKQGRIFNRLLQERKPGNNSKLLFDDYGIRGRGTLTCLDGFRNAHRFKARAA